MDAQLDKFIEKVMTKINSNLSVLRERTTSPNKREIFIAIRLPLHHALQVWARRSATLAQTLAGVDHQNEMAKLRRKLVYIFNDPSFPFNQTVFQPTGPIRAVEADIVYVEVVSENSNQIVENTDIPNADALPLHRHHSDLFGEESTQQIRSFYRFRDSLSLSNKITLQVASDYALAANDWVRFSQHNVLNGPYEALAGDILHKLDFIIYEYQKRRYPWWLRYGVYGLQALSNVLLFAGLMILFIALKKTLMIFEFGAIIYAYFSSRHVEILDKKILYSEVKNTLSAEQMAVFYQHYLKEHLLFTTEETHCSDDTARTIVTQSLPEQYKEDFEKKRLEFLQAHYERVWGIQHLKILLDTTYKQLTTSNPGSFSQRVFNLFLWGWALPMLCIELIIRPIQLLFAELLSMLLPVLFWSKAILTLLCIAPLLLYDYCFPSNDSEEEIPSTANQVKSFLSFTIWKIPTPHFAVEELANDAWLSNPQIMHL